MAFPSREHLLLPYIQILGSTDRYKTERVEFLRGANSMLFGLAEPAGLMNYSRRIFSGRVRWKVQLNAQNLIGDHGLRVIAANPDGSSIWGLAPARTYELSHSFEF